MNGGIVRDISLGNVPTKIRNMTTLDLETVDFIRGMITNEPMKAGEKIFWIPFHLTIHPEVAMHDPHIGPLLESSILDENSALLIWFLFSLLHIEHSPYRP